MLEEEQGEQQDEGQEQYDDDDYDDGYEGGRGPAFTPPTRPRTGKAALPLKRDRVCPPPESSLPPACSSIRVDFWIDADAAFAFFLMGLQTRSKRFLEIQKLRESKKEHDVPTAISLVKQMASARFVESAEAHFRMNLDPKYNDQQLRATVIALSLCCCHCYVRSVLACVLSIVFDDIGSVLVMMCRLICPRGRASR